MDLSDPANPPKGFAGRASAEVNSVYSDMSETNAVQQRDTLNVTIGRITSNTDSTRPASSMASASSFDSVNFSTINNSAASIFGTPVLNNSTMNSANDSNVSNNTVISFTGTIAKTPKAKTVQCRLCDQAIIDRSKCVKCAVCLGLTHFKCAESGMMDEAFLKVFQKKGNLYYTCVKCSSTSAKQIRIINKDGIEESEDLRKAFLQIGLNEEIMKRQAAELDRAIERNTQMQIQLSRLQTTGMSSPVLNESEPLAIALKSQLDDSAKRNIVLANENLALVKENKTIMIEVGEMRKELKLARLVDRSLVHDLDETDESKDELISKLNSEVRELKSQIAKFMNTHLAGTLPKGKRPRPMEQLTDHVVQERTDRVTDQIQVDLTGDLHVLNENEDGSMGSARTVVDQNFHSLSGGNLTGVEDILTKFLGHYQKDMVRFQDELLRINVRLDEQSKKDERSKRGGNLNDKDFPPLGQNLSKGQDNRQSRPNRTDKRVQIRERDQSGSVSKGSRNASVQKERHRFANRTFAEMVQSSKTKPDSIRNIRINADTEEEIKRISAHLSNNYACQDVGIKKISSRSADYMTVTCKTELDAQKLERTLNTEYGKAINISKVRDSDPKFKIVGIILGQMSPTQFLLNLKEQNDWLTNANLTYVEHFGVPSKRGSYTNMVIACDVPTLRRVLEKGEVICGLDMKRVFEYIDILQCFNCQRFGHVANSCRASPSCKFCGGEHQSKLCDDRDNQSCINCIRENKNGHKLNFKHRATDERCKVRGARIDGLKEFASKN